MRDRRKRNKEATPCLALRHDESAIHLHLHLHLHRSLLHRSLHRSLHRNRQKSAGRVRPVRTLESIIITQSAQSPFLFLCSRNRYPLEFAARLRTKLRQVRSTPVRGIDGSCSRTLPGSTELRQTCKTLTFIKSLLFAWLIDLILFPLYLISLIVPFVIPYNARDLGMHRRATATLPHRRQPFLSPPASPSCPA